jgi:hypothetical protein
MRMRSTKSWIGNCKALPKIVPESCQPPRWQTKAFTLNRMEIQSAHRGHYPSCKGREPGLCSVQTATNHFSRGRGRRSDNDFTLAANVADTRESLVGLANHAFPLEPGMFEIQEQSQL